MAVTPDGQQVVSASSDGTLKVWDLASGRQLRTLRGHSDSVTAVAVTPDGQRAVSASSDGALKVWDLASGRQLRTLTSEQSVFVLAATAVALTPDGQRAISTCWDDMLQVWDLSSGRELRINGHSEEENGGASLFRAPDRVTAVAATRDGQRAVSGSKHGALQVWDLSSGRELLALTAHSGAVTAVVVTPDGQRAVSASSDETLKVWDLASGHELRALTGHSDGVTAVVVTRDGRRAISASRDHTVKTWDLETGKVVATFTCDGAASCCTFSDALELIFAGDIGGHVHFLHLEEAKRKCRTS